MSSPAAYSSSSSHSDTLPLHENVPLPHKDTLLHKMAPPLLRHQASLESVLDFATTPPFTPDEGIQGRAAFMKIIDHSSSYELTLPLVHRKPYNRGKLLWLVHEHAISDYARDNILVYFLTTLLESPGPPHGFSDALADLAGFEEKSKEEKDQIAQRVQELADHLVDYFFLPFKGLSAKTPQPTPRLSAPLQQDDNTLVGTTQRLKSLRGRCLLRDRHRCVISRLFDAEEADRRLEINGRDATDDDGLPLINEEVEYLEVAHIIPHALASSDDPSKLLGNGKAYALRVLDMFDPGIIHLVQGANIDRPYNALTLSLGFRRHFGSLKIFFEAVPGFPNRYIIKATNPLSRFRPTLPITRDLFITSDHNIDPPMARLLAIHRACCLIMHLSGAGEYIDKVLRDMEEIGVRSDGTTELGSIISLRLHQRGEQAKVF